MTGRRRYSWIPWTLGHRRICAVRTYSMATMDCQSTSFSPHSLTAPSRRTAHPSGPCCWGKDSGRPHWHPCSMRNTGKPALPHEIHPWGYAPEEGTWGGRDPRAERCGVCSDCSKETEEEIHPRPRRMESISTTHHDYRAMGFQSTPQPTTQRHNYLTEQPTSFWLEQARGQPGVTALFGRNIPFKRNADFSTPITMYLGHPEPFNLCDPYDPLSRQLQSHK
ncbi:sperm-associated antigen 8 isoform X2 [Serinus canaria]|uniref:sperm-associated antigen 8 isoform X2 n=1 Tax=Serinus canaria TaxID=9135 RepID=UPI0021CCF908|nr:sperm-associated antigen 8 isoform X2 [Serinus canaria]